MSSSKSPAGGVLDKDVEEAFSFKKVSDLHRLFLRTLVARRCVGEGEAASLVTQLGAASSTAGNPPLKELIADLNDALREFRFEITSARSEADGERCYCFVSTELDAGLDFVLSHDAELLARLEDA